jgi:hypothetical protein
VEWTSIRRWIGTPRGRFVSASAGFAAVVGVVAWAALLRDGAGPLPQASAVAPAPPASAGLPAAAPASAATPLLAADPSGPEEVQICGGAWLKAAADGRVSAEEAKAFSQRATDEAGAQTLAAMAASSDERAQAAAHFYQARGERFQQLCGNDGQCVRPTGASRGSAGPEITALVQLAQGSTDPDVYAWAYGACSEYGSSAESPCQLVTAEQWSRLDPTNATPWLFMAAEADKRGDVDGLNEAMFHVAKAERQDTGWGLLTSEVVDYAPAGDAHLNETVNLAIQVLGVEAALPIPFYSTALKYCGVGNLVDANRRETCEGIAALFLEKSSTLVDHGMGLGIGKRLGWPQERIQALQEESMALLGAIESAVPQGIVGGSCKELRQTIDYFRDLRSYGELGTARRAVVASGKPTSVLAANSIRTSAEVFEKLRREEAAASAASATAN